MESPELIDFDAAGALLGFSGRTVRRMVARGTFVRAVAIPGVRGKRLRRQDVLDWLKSLPGGHAAVDGKDATRSR